MNVALYNPRRHLWAMTERIAKKLQRGPEYLQIGPSSLAWDGTALTAGISEITVPMPQRLRGKIRLLPERIEPQVYELDATGRHRWRPIAPRARIEVHFEKPALSWSGQAYFDSNHGDAPLGQDFSTWNWSRTSHAGQTDVLYDVQRRDGKTSNLALRFNENGVQNFAPPPLACLPRGLWRVARQTRADAGFKPSIIKSFEDSPFYTRAKIASQMHGEAVTAVHESLNLNRFAAPWVQILLPFRMPRAIF
jgi:carotenoid 1,2-hydratase